MLVAKAIWMFVIPVIITVAAACLGLALKVRKGLTQPAAYRHWRGSGRG